MKVLGSLAGTAVLLGALTWLLVGPRRPAADLAGVEIPPAPKPVPQSAPQPAPAPSGPSVPPKPHAPPASDPYASERSAAAEWKKIEDSKDATALRNFIARYGATRYGDPAAFALARVEYLELLEKRDVAGIERFIQRNEGHRNVSDLVHAARSRIGVRREENDRAAAEALPSRLDAAFRDKNLAAVQALLPDLTREELSRIGTAFERSQSIRLRFGRGGAYLRPGGTSAELNHQLDVTAVTATGDPLSVRVDWVRMEAEKVDGAWVIRTLRKQSGGPPGRYAGIEIPPQLR